MTDGSAAAHLLVSAWCPPIRHKYLDNILTPGVYNADMALNFDSWPLCDSDIDGVARRAAGFDTVPRGLKAPRSGPLQQDAAVFRAFAMSLRSRASRPTTHVHGTPIREASRAVTT